MFATVLSVVCIACARAMYLPGVRPRRPFVYFFLGLGVVCCVFGVHEISAEMRGAAAHDTWVYGSIVLVALIYLVTWFTIGIILTQRIAEEREAVRAIDERGGGSEHSHE